MSYYFAFEHSFQGKNLVIFSKDSNLVEETVIKKFKEVSDPGDELIMTKVEGVDTYAVRRKIRLEPEDDGFEYIDNDGNPIKADGTDILDSAESDPEVEVEKYDYPGDFYWTLGMLEPNIECEIEDEDLYQTISLAPMSPFENEDEVSLVATA